MGRIELIYNDVYEELGRRALRPILLIVIIYIIYKMLTFYINPNILHSFFVTQKRKIKIV